VVTISACIEMLFSEEGDFLKRIDLAAAAGLKAVEFWGHSGKDLGAIRERADANGLKISSTVVERQPLAQPGDIEGYKEAVVAGIAAAKKIGAPAIIACTGNEIAGVARQEQHAMIVTALKAAAPLAEDAGITIVLEPLNILVDHKGYYLWSSLEGFEILRAVNSPNVKLLFDIYHQQICEGNLIANITDNIDLIGHFHIADVPGRHEPGTGEINYENVLARIRDAGYNGFAALECTSTKPASKDAIAPFLAIRDKLGLA
jgi:hydroxypyruvate isomerase